MHKILSATLLLILATAASHAAPVPNDTLAETFQNPPAAARPWVYWWWMGRVSKESITRDLEALKTKGIGGMTLYHCDEQLLPSAVFGPPKSQWSPEWNDMLRFADSEAKRLGLEFIINYTGGSTGCAGPWIDMENSGQIIVNSGIRVKGGSRIDVVLPQPETRENFYRDVSVIAYPVSKTSKQRPTRMCDASPTLKVSSMEDRYYFEPQYLLDGDASTLWSSSAGRSGGEYIDVTFPEPFATAGVFVAPRNGWTPAVVDLQVSDDGKTYRSLVRQDMEPNQPFTLTIPEVKGRWFRVAFPASQSKDGRIGVAELRLLAPSENGQGALLPYNRFAQQIANTRQRRDGLLAMSEAGDLEGGAMPDLSNTPQVVDLTSCMDEHGRLRWDPPASNSTAEGATDDEWEILRFGRTSLGWRSTVGLAQGSRHVDYLNSEAIKTHFTTGLDPVLKAIGHDKDSALSALHEDSFEMPYNRWTASFPAEFKKRRGYDPMPWIPVLAGRVVQSQGASERFLWDYRRTIADLYITHWEMAQELCHERGLKFESEAAGPEPYCFDALAQLGRTDIPMGEFWSGIYRPGVAVDDQGRGCWPGPECETIRQTASAAHIYGRPIVAAESFTGYSRPFVLDPFDIKAFGDRAFCDGLNRNVIHLFMTQPLEEVDGKPVVVRLHAFDFNRRTTWFEQSRFWTDYLARCSAMLQQGRPVADICCFIGEGAPAMVPQREFMEPKIPDNYDYDACNAETLLKATVKDGRVSLPGGGSYAVLTLPPAQRAMTPVMLRHLRDLVHDGATVLGPKPRYSPSLSDHENADREVQSLSDELWGKADTASGENTSGRGRVIWGKPLAEVLASVSCPPAFTANGAAILFIQRRTENADWFFLSNQAKKEVNFTGKFRAPAGTVPELWDPATGLRKVASIYRNEAGTVELPMQLDPRGSVFVVLRKSAAPEHWSSISKDGKPVGISHDFEIVRSTHKSRLIAWSAGKYELRSESGNTHNVDVPSPPPALDLSKSWELTFEGLGRNETFETLVSWTTLPEDELKCYSGAVTYRKHFNWTGPSARADLDLGELKNIAEVTLNGKKVGLLWKPPYRLDITAALKTGGNELVVRVTNLLVNRITGDFALPAKDRHLLMFGAVEQYRAGAAKDGLLPSGLFGPVTLRTAFEAQIK